MLNRIVLFFGMRIITIQDGYMYFVLDEVTDMTTSTEMEICRPPRCRRVDCWTLKIPSSCHHGRPSECTLVSLLSTGKPTSR